MMYEQEVASLRAQAKRLFGNEDIWVEMHPCIAWDKVVNQNPKNTSPSEINEPYEPSPRMYSYEQPSCLGSTFVEFPKSQPKRIYNEDLECEIVMVKMPKCMAWLDYETIGDLDMMEDKVDNPSPQRISMEVEPLEHTKREDLSLDTSTHDLFLSSKGFPSVDEPEPQLLPKFSPLDVFSTWMAFGGNTHDLGSFGEETDKITDLHQIHEEVLFTEREDGVASIKRRRRDLSSDDEALDEEACLEEQILSLMHRFADRFTNHRPEINRLMILDDHPLIEYGRYALGCMTGADMKKAAYLKSVRDELQEKR
ncbi:hypothetical protein Tco_0533098 [Tanacetum coccineum]